MKALLKYGLSLALGLAPASAFAQELQWRPTAAPGVPPVTLNRPVPLDGSALDNDSPGAQPALRTIFRAQNPEEPRPLPAGPPAAPGGLTDSKIPQLSPFPVSQETGKQPAKNGEFIGPPPQPSRPLPPIASPSNPLCDPCCSPRPSVCCGLLGHHSLFGHDGCCFHCLFGPDGCLAKLFAPNCDPCCCNRPHIWGNVEYLLWVPQNQSFPPLVTISPAGTPLGVAGIIGAPTTVVAFDRFDDVARSGLRIGGGFWFTQNGCWGLDASYWFLGSQSRTSSLGSTGNPIIARPFTEVGPIAPGPNAELVAFPGLVNGTVSVSQRQQLWGLDANLRRKLCCGPYGWLDLQLGYRHFYLSEGLDVTENLTLVPPLGTPTGTNILVSDRFHTSNSFNAPQVGLAWQWNFLQRWNVGTDVKVGLGVNHEVVDIHGNTIFTIPGVATTPQVGGLLTLPTNIGRQSHDRFAVMPEVGLKLGFNITPHLSIYAGYDFLYISSVVRPANQVDPGLNSTQRPNAFGPQPLVGVARPAPQFNTSDFWVQGFNLGLQYKW
jgi:hypothetical protein